MKKMLLVLLLLCSSVAIIFAADNAEKIKIASENLLYFKTELFFGTKVISAANPKGYGFGSDELKDLLKTKPAAMELYEKSSSSLGAGLGFVIVGLLGGGGMMTAGLWNALASDTGSDEINGPLAVSGIVVMLVGAIIGQVYLFDADNLYYQAIHEYNKSLIYGDARQGGIFGIKKTISF